MFFIACYGLTFFEEDAICVNGYITINSLQILPCSFYVNYFDSLSRKYFDSFSTFSYICQFYQKVRRYINQFGTRLLFFA